MKLRLRFEFGRRVLLAIAYRIGIRTRPAHRDEVVDFVEGAVEDATEKALEDMDGGK